MEIQGTVINKFATQNGVSGAGKPWSKQSFVIETNGPYPKKVHFTIFGAERIEQNKYSVGQNVTVRFEVSSREYKDKWYTDLNALSVIPASQQQQPAVPDVDFMQQSKSDKLPF